MDWFGAGGNGPLIVIRAIHFAATAVTTGTLVFRTAVARPAFRSAPRHFERVRAQTRHLTWSALVITVASGVIWLLLETAAMSGLPFNEAMAPSVLSTALNETQFGLVSEIRLGLVIVLAVCLAYDRFPPADWLAVAAATGLTAAVAWTGHGGSTSGELGKLHLAADALHLIAAASWIGGLIPLVLLLAQARKHPTVEWASIAGDAAERFSILGVVSVATLMATGFVNAWILVGSFDALFVTEYGRLLMLKIIVFAVLLVLAAINRFWLTPRLAAPPENGARIQALRQLTRNSIVEIAFGLAIFAIVGMLGTLHPAIHMM
ncbi:MAG TPA: copper homeostasis membrane protein CopD [Rhodopila sp.]